MVTRGESWIQPFQMVDETTYTPLSGLTVTVELSMDGGDFTAATNAAIETGSGWYKVELSDTETDHDTIVLKATATGAAQSSGLLEPAAPSTTTINNTNSTTTMGGGSAAALLYARGCSWADKDIKLITNFFKKSEEYIESINADKEPMTAVNTKLMEFMTATNVQFTQVHIKLDELIQTQEKLELLAIKNATLDQLEGYNGSN